MPVPFRADRRLARIRGFSDEELLDRVTILKEQMDDDALELMHTELTERGIGPDDIGAHLRDLRPKVIMHPDDTPATCFECGRAAVVQARAWHRLWGVLPLFKRTMYWCEEHATGGLTPRRS
jgi:hypothetical protein